MLWTSLALALVVQLQDFIWAVCNADEANRFIQGLDVVAHPFVELR